jgi:hypothetical protein
MQQKDKNSLVEEKHLPNNSDSGILKFNVSLNEQ